MKRLMTRLAGAAFLATVVGCGSAGIEEGMPSGDTKQQTVDVSKLVDPANSKMTPGAMKKTSTPPASGDTTATKK